MLASPVQRRDLPPKPHLLHNFEIQGADCRSVMDLVYGDVDAELSFAYANPVGAQNLEVVDPLGEF